MSRLRFSRARPLLFALSSATLLIASFPNFNQPWCAWAALVPWLLLLRKRTLRSPFWWSYAIGLLFFLVSMWWLVHVTLVGWIILCVYLALYFGLFGLIVSRLCLQPRTSNLQRLLVVSASWVALEFARSHLLSGMGWNLLAYSQAGWPIVIQFADVTGAWGVSFVIVLVNVAIAESLGRRTRAKRRGSKSWASMIHLRIMSAGILLVAFGYGAWRLHNTRGAGAVRIAVVQGNIPQEEKWDEEHQQSIIERYEALTQQVAASHPDLIVWPETSVPGYFGVDEALTQRVLTLARTLKIPMLVGAPMLRLHATQFLLSNSAALVDPAGTIVSRYDKVHLVPFGEFIPFERNLPWLRQALPPIGDFVPGHEYTVFTAPVRNSEFGIRSDHSAFRLPAAPRRRHGTPHSALKFSVLICFEDVFPELARRFVQHGAQALLVITNDAWFGPTAAAYQHVQASTFRAIELRVPVIRAANTGWSGCIDPFGRWCGSVRDTKGAELFVAGTHTCDVMPGTARSFYQRWGDWFAWVCVIILGTVLVPGIVLLLRAKRAKNEHRPRSRVH